MPKNTLHGYRVKCKPGFNVKKIQLIKIIAVDNWYGTINVLSRKNNPCGDSVWNMFFFPDAFHGRRQNVSSLSVLICWITAGTV